MIQLIRINFRYSRELPLEHPLVQPVHILRPKWRNQSAYLINYAPKRPDVTLGVIWQVFPDFRTCIVGRSCLSIEHSLFSHFRNVKISEFCHFMRLLILLVEHINFIRTRCVVIKKNVGWLEISVKDVHDMQLLQASDNGYEYLPNYGFIHVTLWLLASANLLIEISVVSILHHYAQVFVLVSKCFFISHDVRVVNRSQDPHFVKGILALTGWKRIHWNLFESVYLTIWIPFNFVNLTVWTLAYIWPHFKQFITYPAYS